MSNDHTISSMKKDLREATETMRGTLTALAERGETVAKLASKSKDILTDTVELNRRSRTATGNRTILSRCVVCLTISILLITFLRLALFVK